MHKISSMSSVANHSGWICIKSNVTHFVNVSLSQWVKRTVTQTGAYVESFKVLDIVGNNSKSYDYVSLIINENKTKHVISLMKNNDVVIPNCGMIEIFKTKTMAELKPYNGLPEMPKANYDMVMHP